MNWRVRVSDVRLFAVVCHTISFVDLADDRPIILMLDAHEAISLLEFFLEGFIPLIGPERGLDLSDQFWVQIMGMAITGSREGL